RSGFGIADSLLTLNVMLKKDSKAGYLGKVEAGAGSEKKYDVALTNIFFRENLSVALVVGGNNINKKATTVTEALKNSTFRNTNPNLSNAPDFTEDGTN